MGSKEDKEFFWGFKSNVSFVLLILGAMVIGNLLYENYQSFVRDKQNEQRQEINKSKENKKKDLESSDKIESEKIENQPTTKDDSPASVRKIICTNCEGTGREILPCSRCNYNINCERQGSGGYTQASRTNGIWRCRPCSDCDGRGVFPKRCGPCGGTGRVNEFE